ncbi:MULTISPECIES: hypothetical protein [Flavobacterium]|uniref:Uncharacterized protein n=1 Tax=Flavobacterium davisii TaxID=2906077 RepID=A0ABW8PPL4_9FLAO
MTTKQEFSQAWRSIGNIFAGFAIGAFVAFFAVKCTNSKEIEPKIVKGRFQTNKIKNTPIKAVVEIKKETGKNLSNSEKTKNIFLQKKIDRLLSDNEKLLAAFAVATVAKKDSLYNEAIELNEFSKPFEDKFIKADVRGIARGTVESIVLNYEILPQPVKQKNHLYIGFTAGNSAQFDKPVFGAGLMYQLKKGNLIRLGYDSDKRVSLGYDLKVF